MGAGSLATQKLAKLVSDVIAKEPRIAKAGPKMILDQSESKFAELVNGAIIEALMQMSSRDVIAIALEIRRKEMLDTGCSLIPDFD